MKRFLTLFLVLLCAWVASGGPLDSMLPIKGAAGGGAKFPLTPPLTVSPSSAEIARPGYSFSLVATSPSSGAISYSSSDPTIASVSAAGLVTIGYSTGSTDITVSQAAVGSYFAAAQAVVPVVASWDYLPWDIFNVALYTDGSDDYAKADMTGIPTGTSEITVMMWVHEVNAVGGNSLYYFWGCGDDNSYLAFRFGNASGVDFVGGPAVGEKRFVYERNNTDWFHLALVASSTLGSVNIYVNGEDVATKTYLAGNAASAFNRAADAKGFVLGSHHNLTAKYKMKFAEVSVWNKILSQEEVQFYKGKRLNGNEPNLIRYYRCEENAGTTLTDICASGYDATLYQGATWTTKL